MPLDTLDSRHVSSLKKSSYVKSNFKKKKRWDFCPVASVTGHVRFATCVQSWTHVVYPTHPVATGHWTEVKSKKKKYMELEFHSRNLITYYYISYRTIKYIIMNTKNIYLL